MADVPPGYYRTELNRTVWVVPDKYQDLSPIGTGAYGQVCSATNATAGEQVAIKKLSRPFQTTMDTKRSLRELKLLRHMNHENVIGLLDVFTPDTSFEEFQDVYMVTDFMGADLNRILKCNKLTDEHVQFLVYQMLRGLKYIHSAGVIHGKLEPRNIFANEDCELKILDFHQARMAEEEMTVFVGKRWYRAPEIMLNQMRYIQNPAVDVWSVGCIMAELLTSKTLFPGRDPIDQLTQTMRLVGKPDMNFISKLTTDAARHFLASVPEYQKRPFSTVFTDANPKAVDLLEKMLDLDPDTRITAEQALAHPYLAIYSDPEDEPTCEPFDELQFEAKDEEHWPTDKWRELVYNEIVDFQMRKKEKDLASKEILDFQTRKEEKVPPEILARGPLALEAFIKALAEGIACVKRVPVMLIGQENAGKTSLKKSLRREPFNPDEDRTIGIEVDPSHFKVSTEIWKVGEKDQEKNAGTNSFYEYHTARLTVENLREEESIAKGGVSPEAVESSNIPLVKAAVGNVSSDSVSSATAVPSTSRHDSAKSLIDISEDPQSNEAISCLESTQTSRNAQLGGDKPDMPDDIATLIEMLLKEVDKVEDEEDIYSVLWDFAGQSVFYTTHPLFLTTRAIYLLVNDLSQNPFERAKSIVTQGMFSQREDAFGVKTNVDYLDLWMSSIASLANEDENHQEGFESEVLTEKLPPVFLVCTHADTPYNGGDPNTLAQKVFGHLRSKPYKTHLYEDVFVVDNTKSGQESECSEIARLRKEVLDLAKELPQLKEAIPIKWLRYEKALQTMKEDGQKWISLDTAKKIALEVCNIADEKQIQTLLNFLHDQRILIHFDDTPKLNKLVVLDPQWLIDVFKKVITIRPFNRKEKRFEELWRKLEEEGILEEKLLEHIWGPLFDNKETPESLLEIMEKFSLLCSWPSSDASCSKEYLVPSMLMSHPPEGITQLVASARFPSLFLKFESGKVPLGLFSRLVLHFIQWGKDQYTSAVVPQLYQNFARLYTSKDCSVVLLCHLSFIQVVVLGGCPILELVDSLQSKLNLSVDVSYDTFEVTRAVRRQLELMLETMRNEFCWLKNMKCEVCFLCPVCCQGGKLNCCRKHRTEGCKEEECLHFWSESKLCNAKANLCLKSAVAHNPTVQVEQFSPWLTPTGNQRAIDDNGKKLSPVEAGKEIALPSEVQASLLSKSFDAKEVVLQLKESLQLDQASLEQPEPETKALICCLARKAKDSNRLDVFKHLREISPAGTTGPLLPEQLDVRSIPVAKGRELTIDLSGGEEWMVVAEGLGLTPQEIRFLNNRTLNPLEAALAFIARQRLLTVGELYDLLSRSGYPVLADLL